jgi:hypothetical protein
LTECDVVRGRARSKRSMSALDDRGRARAVVLTYLRDLPRVFN